MVVSTPHKVLESMEDASLSIGDVQYLVIDEADTMFDPRFSLELKRIIRPLKMRGLPFSTILVSATMSKEMKKIIAELVPDILPAATSSLHRGVYGSQHNFVPVEAGRDKIDVLSQVCSRFEDLSK